MIRRGISMVMMGLALSSCDGNLQVDDESTDKNNGGGGNPTTPEIPPTAPVGTGVASNDVACPHDAPEVPGACPSNGLLCAYAGREGDQFSRTLCGCWPDSGSTLGWYCYLQDRQSYECPAEYPEGQSCWGSRGIIDCPYLPRVQCSCSGTDEEMLWECRSLEIELAEPPATLDPNTPVAEMSAAQREEWCRWSVPATNQPGAPEPLEQGVDSDGYALNTGCRMGSDSGSVCNGLLPDLPVSYCMANLELSTCEAPLAELSDCVLTILGSCWPAPNGCAPYLERPGCAGTIVPRYDGDPMTSCTVRVE